MDNATKPDPTLFAVVRELWSEIAEALKEQHDVQLLARIQDDVAILSMPGSKSVHTHIQGTLEAPKFHAVFVS